jgi:hypothetical protein
MALWLVFNNKSLAFVPSQLLGAGLFCVEMVEARPAGNYFSVFCDFQSFAK